jgi:hypothetical protein
LTVGPSGAGRFEVDFEPRWDRALMTSGMVVAEPGNETFEGLPTITVPSWTTS